MIIETIAGVTHQLMSIFIPEIVFWIFVERYETGFKFRFSRIADYPGLKPFANTWVVGFVAILIYLFSPRIFEFILGTAINSWLVSLGLLKLLALTISLGCFDLIYFVNYIVGKKLDVNTAIIGLIAIVSFGIFFYLIEF